MSKSDSGDQFPGPNASNGAMADIFRFWDVVNCLYKCHFKEKWQNNPWPISADIGGIRPNSGSRQMHLGELVPKISVSARDLNPEIKI